MPVRPRIQWQVLDVADSDTLWTPGWLPDTSTLRWSLANSMRIEGVRDYWSSSFVASDHAEIHEGYVAENDDGDFIEVTSEGVYEATGESFSPFKAATFAVLKDPPRG